MAQAKKKKKKEKEKKKSQFGCPFGIVQRLRCTLLTVSKISVIDFGLQSYNQMFTVQVQLLTI